MYWKTQAGGQRKLKSNLTSLKSQNIYIFISLSLFFFPTILLMQNCECKIYNNKVKQVNPILF